MYLGAKEALIETVFPEASFFHGEDGFGDVEHETVPDTSVIEKENAINAIYRIVMEVNHDYKFISKCFQLSISRNQRKYHSFAFHH